MNALATVFTVITGLATGALAVLAYLQWQAFLSQRYWMKRTTEVMQDTEERQLRAYLSALLPDPLPMIPERGIRPDGRGNLDIWVIVQNFGQTPAYSLSCAVETSLMDLPHDMGQVRPASNIAQPNQVVAPGERVPVALVTPIPRFTDSQKAVGQTYFLCGIVRYLDAFRKERSTKFRMTVELERGGGFVYGEIENYSDDQRNAQKLG